MRDVDEAVSLAVGLLQHVDGNRGAERCGEAERDSVKVKLLEFFERELGVWPAIGLTLSVVSLSVGIYLVLGQRRA